MLGSRAWFALMRRNLLYRQRHWVMTLLEMALPVCFLSIVIAIKNSLGDDDEVEIVEPTFPTAPEDVFRPLSFMDFTLMLQAARICTSAILPGLEVMGRQLGNFDITGMPGQGYDWQNPFIRCDNTQCREEGQDAQDFCEYSFLGVAPKAEARPERAQALVDYIYATYPILRDPGRMPFDFEFVRLFDSEDAMVNYVTAEGYGFGDRPKMSLGVVMDTGDTANDYPYTIRQNSTGFNVPSEAARPGALTTPDTARTFDPYAPNDDSCSTFDGGAFLGPRQGSCTGQYLYNGVLTVQKLIHDFILEDSGVSVKVADHGISFVPFPTRQYEEGGFFSQVADFLPLLFTLGLLFPVSQMISYVCREKELRQKELLKMMSVTESDLGWSWFVSFFTLHLVVATLCSIVSTRLYTNSTWFILWIFWVFTFLALVVFSMLLASLSAKTTRTVLIGLLAVFMGVFLIQATSYEDGATGTISLLSLHPVTAFSYGLMELGRLEDQGTGATSDTISDTINPSGYTFSNALQALAVDAILWGIVTWYLNRVIAPDFGQALSWNFPLTPSYWGFSKKSETSAPESAFNQTDEQVNPDAIPMEKVSDALRSQPQKNIIVRHLGKRFGDKTAVDNLNVTMYNGQVTALLGHNGAGKTTTISMLTGALATTTGGAKLMGKDLATDLSSIREDLGICLQHDCLFPGLTVREHIQFFARLKGLYRKVSRQEAEESIDQIIRDVALYEKRNTYSKNLSGGMKRKLSVAIAFCGGSKVVLLDEPTSGMDPFSRRFTWNVIRQYRQNRVILLTTHFMDEADVLGDRIAIMSGGELRCSGSPLFLKKHYGVGYQLTIEKDHEFSGKASKEEMEELDSALRSTVNDKVKDASMLNNVGSEMTFQLPIGEASNFGPMFDLLDGNPNVASYGIGVTTLEEVFLLVARGDEVADASKRQMKSARIEVNAPSYLLDGDKDTDTSSRSRMNLEQDNLFFTHVGALLVKRAANFRRDKKAWCCTTILPALFVLIGLLIFAYAGQDRSLDSLELSIDDYNPEVTSSPRNPIVVNDVSSVFPCQPGQCSYFPANLPFIHPDYDDHYALCGVQALVDRDETLFGLLDPLEMIDSIADSAGQTTCQVDSSVPFMSSINEAGIEIIEADLSSIENASRFLYDNLVAHEASQFAGIYYTHDDSSLLEDGSRFDDTIVANCTRSLLISTAAGVPLLNNENDCSKYTGLGFVIQYNFTANHVAPTYMSVATEAIARSDLGVDDFTIRPTIHPLPLTFFEESVVETEDSFSAWFLLVLSFPFIAGSFGTFIVAERESKAKHLQTVTGVKPAGYWVSTYIWDIINYQFPLWIVVAMFFIFDITAFTTTEFGAVGGVICSMVLFGPAAAGFTYCLSYLFKSPAFCNVAIIISGFLIGMGGPLTVIILTFIGENPFDPKPHLVDVATILSWILRFHPCFCLGRSLYFALNVGFLTSLYPQVTTVWSPEILLWDVVFLAWESFVYLLLAIQIDIWSTNPGVVSVWKKFVMLLKCSRRVERDGEEDSTEEDSDVIAEEERITTGGGNNDLIVVDKLRKVYDNGKVAVKSLSLGIPPGQVFGLLGVNGAGKTTTMAMLTAEFPATSGDATLAGYSVTKQPEKTRRRVGYCPQFDAHFANMTGREHVELYATIKGVPKEFVKEAAAGKLAEVGLSPEDSDRLAADYSGGMKRRLSLATATIGDPQIVFLDECSTGVDPVARREIWELISRMVSNRHVAPEERTSVILTTHSMEECEALCPRIGIMAGGRLRALGSAQQLKNKFGKGYQIEMKAKLVTQSDPDYLDVAMKLGQGRTNQPVDIENHDGPETAPGDAPTDTEVYFNLEQTIEALRNLTGDDYLACIINDHNPIGYNIFSSASSLTGCHLEELAAFATLELRIRKIAEFIVDTYTTNIFRERQDTKVRYEVNAEGVRISSIFASIEENKERLQLDDYGVSQTSLEQVFNMHAAEAEKHKTGTNDG